MPKMSEGRTSALTVDGALPFMLTTPEITFATAAQSGKGQMLVPFPCNIVDAFVNVRTTATDTGARNIKIGTPATASAFLAAWDVDVASAGMQRIPLATFVTTEIPAGTVLEVSAPAATTGSGVISVTLICSPNA